MNVVIYARYSSDKQREESIEGQLKFCYAYAEREGHYVVGEYIDRAMSAKTDNRPEFQKMIRDSKKEKFQGVLVYQLDRFARNRFDSAKYKAILKSNNAKLISANEHIAEGSSGIILESVLEGWAEYYSAELSEKVTRGMNINAEKCLSNGGRLPLGYKIENKRYVIDETSAPIVVEIFTKYASGMRAKDICDELNQRQVKTSSGSAFNKGSLHSILINRKYLGIYIYNGQEPPGGMPQIIEEALFNKVADRMKLNKKAPARARAKAEYLLTSKLFCGHCKEMMIGHRSNKISKNGIRYNYYKCKNAGAQKTCQKKMIAKDYIEDVVVKECQRILSPSNIRRIAIETVKIAKGYDDSCELKRLEGILKKRREAQENQMAALRECNQAAVRQMIFKDLNRIGIEITELESQIKIEQSKHHILTEEQVVSFLVRLSEGDFDDLSYRKTLIKVLINKIFLYDDSITITFNSGDEEVTITDKLFADIENNLRDKEAFCLLNKTAHQKKDIQLDVFFQLYLPYGKL